MNLPSFRMDGKVALLTGSGRGIGLAMAQAFASAGALVALQDIDLEVAEKEAQAIRSEGGRAIALGGDVTELTLAPKLVQQTVDQLGGLHVLVNNAAIQTHEPWLDMSLQNLKRQIDADLIFPILLTQHATPILQQQHYGRILNLGSVQQRSCNPWMLAYSASKAALEKITIAWAKNLASAGITVNLIAPGWFNTHRNAFDFKDADDMKAKGKKIPLGRIGEPIDCAGLALLLCSEAGSYITGQTIFVDGGLGQ